MEPMCSDTQIEAQAQQASQTRMPEQQEQQWDQVMDKLRQLEAFSNETRKNACDAHKTSQYLQDGIKAVQPATPLRQQAAQLEEQLSSLQKQASDLYKHVDELQQHIEKHLQQQTAEQQQLPQQLQSFTLTTTTGTNIVANHNNSMEINGSAFQTRHLNGTCSLTGIACQQKSIVLRKLELLLRDIGHQSRPLHNSILLQELEASAHQLASQLYAMGPMARTLAPLSLQGGDNMIMLHYCPNKLLQVIYTQHPALIEANTDIPRHVQALTETSAAPATSPLLWYGLALDVNKDTERPIVKNIQCVCSVSADGGIGKKTVTVNVEGMNLTGPDHKVICSQFLRPELKQLDCTIEAVEGKGGVGWMHCITCVEGGQQTVSECIGMAVHMEERNQFRRMPWIGLVAIAPVLSSISL